MSIIQSLSFAACFVIVSIFGMYHMILPHQSSRQIFQYQEEYTCPELCHTTADQNDTEIVHEGKTYYFPNDLIAKLPWERQFIDTSTSTSGEAESQYHRYLGMIQVECTYRRRVGRMTDGGWDVCLVAPYSLTTHHCLVYSFGISRSWSFDDMMDSTFGCEVHSYDPSIKYSESRRGRNIHYHAMGLYGNRSEVRFKSTSTSVYHVDTLSNLVKQNGHQGRVIDYLKFDIEASEWNAIPEMVASGQLRYVKQLAFEVHTFVFSRRGSLEAFARKMEVLEMLQAAGFRRWHSQQNVQTTKKSIHSVTGDKYYPTCSEAYYININFLKDNIDMR